MVPSLSVPPVWSWVLTSTPSTVPVTAMLPVTPTLPTNVAHERYVPGTMDMNVAPLPGYPHKSAHALSAHWLG